MGVDFHACILYGCEVDLPKNANWDYMDDFNEVETSVEIMYTSPMTSDGRYIMFVKETYISIGEYDDEICYSFTKEVTISEVHWNEQLQRACKQWDLQYIPAHWYVITFFS